jgi:hypothetical protein
MICLDGQLIETAMLLNKPQITTTPVVILAMTLTRIVWLNMPCMKIKAEHFERVRAIQSKMRLA